MGILRHGEIVSEWSCDACKTLNYAPAGIGVPLGWEERGERAFCSACASELDSTDQPRARTSCVAPRRSVPAGQDGGPIQPCEPRRERAWIFLLLAFAAAFAVITLAVLRRSL